MKTTDTKDMLISELYETRLVDRDKWKNLINRIETYLGENEFDDQLNIVLISMKARENDFNSNDFDKCCDIAAPVFEQLEDMSKWGHLELEVLCSMISYNRSYKKSLFLTQKAFEMIDDLEKEGDSRIWKVRAMFSINLTFRLTRARYIDLDPNEQGADLAEIKQAFKHHLKLGRAVLTEKKHAALRTVLNTREALFHRNCDAICDGLLILKHTKEDAWLKALEDEVMDYLSHFRMLLTTPQRNMLLGMRVRRRRQELGMSLDDFADEMGMERTSIIKIENGSVGMFAPNLFNAAHVLGVGISYFYGDPVKKLYETEEDLFAHKIAKAMRNSTDKEKDLVFSITKAVMAQSRE